jgi:hypothetical protein
MNNNRSGTSQLSMSVPKFRAELHKAYIAGGLAARACPTGFEFDEEAKRREFVKQAIIDLNWR